MSTAPGRVELPYRHRAAGRCASGSYRDLLEYRWVALAETVESGELHTRATGVPRIAPLGALERQDAEAMEAWHVSSS